MEEDEMGGPCGTNGREEKLSTKESQKLCKSVRRYFDYVKMGLQETGWYGVLWTDLDQGRESCRVLVSMVFNRRFP